MTKTASRVGIQVEYREKKMTELSTFFEKKLQNICEPQWKCRTFAASKGEHGQVVFKV